MTIALTTAAEVESLTIAEAFGPCLVLAVRLIVATTGQRSG
jgi:hypothetical protein